MSSQLRKVARLRDANYRRSWQTWLETVKDLSLGQRLTIAYQIVPGLRIASQLCVMLVFIVVALVAMLSGAPIVWPEFGN